MSFLDRIKKFFRPVEEVEISLESAISYIENVKGKDINEEKKKESRLREDISKILEKVGNSLKNLNTFESEGRQKHRIEDTVENFRKTRLKLIKDLELQKDYKVVKESLEKFINDFEEMTKKEQVILKRAGEPVNNVFTKFKEFKTVFKKYKDFLDKDFTNYSTKKEIEEVLEQIDGLKDKIEEFRVKKKGLKLQESRKKLENSKENLEKHKKNPKWDEKEELEEKIKELQENLRSEEKFLKKCSSNLERGAKKLLYRSDKEGLLSKSTENTVRKIINGEYKSIKNSSELEKAVKVVENEGILDGKALKKFKESIKPFISIGEHIEKIERLEEDIKKCESDLNSYNLELDQKKLENNVKRAKKDVNNLEEREKYLEDKIHSLRRKLGKKKDILERKVNKICFNRIKISDN